MLIGTGYNKLVKDHEKIEKKIKGVYLWSVPSAAYIIVNNMVEEAGKDKLRWMGKANFIALRLKFADEKTIGLMQNALFKKEKYYTETINGKDTIYETMQSGNMDYYSALLSQYNQTEHCKNSKYPQDIRIPSMAAQSDPPLIKCSKLSDDGSRIIYIPQEEWEKENGPIYFSIDYTPKTKEELDKSLAEIKKQLDIFKKDKK